MKVLQAIANHTLGRPEMSLLSCILCLADTLEPGRGDTPQLESLRQISCQDLDGTIWLTCNYSVKSLLETHCPIHPKMISTRNWFLQKVKDKPSLIQTSASWTSDYCFYHPSSNL